MPFCFQVTLHSLDALRVKTHWHVSEHDDLLHLRRCHREALRQLRKLSLGKPEHTVESAEDVLALPNNFPCVKHEYIINSSKESNSDTEGHVETPKDKLYGSLIVAPPEPRVSTNAVWPAELYQQLCVVYCLLQSPHYSDDASTSATNDVGLVVRKLAHVYQQLLLVLRDFSGLKSPLMDSDQSENNVLIKNISSETLSSVGQTSLERPGVASGTRLHRHYHQSFYRIRVVKSVGDASSSSIEHAVCFLWWCRNNSFTSSRIFNSALTHN